MSQQPQRTTRRKSNQSQIHQPESTRPTRSRSAPPVSLLALRAPLVQTKLSVNTPGDSFEREADTVAAAAVQAPVPAPPAQPKRGSITGVQRLVTPEEETIRRKTVPEEETVQRQGQHQLAVSAALEAAIRSPGMGNPMSAAMRLRIEPHLGADLGGVRVHTGPLAERAALSLHARAFTFQNHIFLNQTESPGNLSLMAHEATHVVQQGAADRQTERDNRVESSSPERLTERSVPEETTPAPPTPASETQPETTELPDYLEPRSGHAETTAAAETPPAATAPEGEAVAAAETGVLASSAAATAAAEATRAEETERMAGVMDRLGQAATEQEGPAAAAGSQARASRGGAAAASAATRSPGNEARAMGQASQVSNMGRQDAGQVDQRSFLELVRQKLEELVPDTPGEADEFREQEGAAGLHDAVMGEVTAQTDAAQQDIRGATIETPTPAAEREPVPLPDETSPTTPDLRAEESLPLPRSEAQVDQPLLDNQQTLADDLEQAKAEEERLERPQDPGYAEIEAAQAEADAHLEQATQAYREQEEILLSQQHGTVAAREQTTRQAMEQARTHADEARAGDQETAMTVEERERQRISDRLEAIYASTQEAVQNRLDRLDEDVNQRFTEGEERAKNRFEEHVDDEMTAWRLERYGTLALIPVVGIALAVGRWVDDQIRDINNFPEVIAIFRDGRDRYLAELTEIIRDISRDVDEALAWCETRIQQGEAEIQTYIGSLPPAQQAIGDRAANDISSRFDQLRGTVESRRAELANQLAQRYQESREALDARIEEIQEENRGLVGQALDLIDSLVAAIQDFRTILPTIARNIPGYTLFTVVIGFNPLTGEAVDRNAINLLEGLMGLVPGGTFIFDTLQERGILQEAFQWVEGELGRLNLSQERIETTIDAAWEEIQIAAGISYNLEVLERHFGQLLLDATTFAESLVDYLIELIKRTAIELLDELLAENQAWALIKKVLHHDPLKDIPVDATTAEIIEDFLMLIGKEQELEQMREQGTVQETADWLDTQLDTFLSLLRELGALFSDAWEAIQPENLPNLMSNLELLAPRVGGFLERLWDFARVVAAKVFELIKNALLTWLQAHANEIPGYHLLTVILEKDVFTEEEVPRTPENLIRGFMSLVPGGEQQFQQMQETGVIPRVAARIESMITELGISWPFIRDLFVGIWDSLSIEDLIDPIGAFTRIIDQFGEPLGRLITFVFEVIKVVLELVLRLMGFPFELIESIIANAMQAFEDIRNDPVGFLLNMLAAVKLGFSNFFDNILTHLLGGLADWLFGGLRDAGVEPPTDFSLSSILDFVLELLGISMERIWEKLGERIGPENVARIRGALDMLEGILNFISDVQERGVVAIWEYIESQISGLWDIILEKAQEWIMDEVISQGIQLLMSFLDVTGIMPVIRGFMSFFRAVQSAIEYMIPILEIINDWVTTIAAVARGDIEPGAQKMEQGLASAIPVAIGFIAKQLGLDDIGQQISQIIEGLREMIDQALDWLFDQAERAIQTLLRTLGLGGEEEEDEQVNQELSGAEAAVDQVMQRSQTLDEAQAQFPRIQQEFNLQSLSIENIGTPNLHVEIRRNPIATISHPDWRNRFMLGGETAHEAPFGATQDVTFGPMYQSGGITIGSTNMTARYLGPNHPQGYETGSRGISEIMKKLVTGREASGAANKFIRGHLLNHDIGGPAEDENLFPITDQANRNHFHSIESKVKTWVNTNRYWVYYQVQVSDIQVRIDSSDKDENYVNSDFICDAYPYASDGSPSNLRRRVTIASRYQTPGSAVRNLVVEEHRRDDAGTEYDDPGADTAYSGTPETHTRQPRSRPARFHRPDSTDTN